VCSDVARRPGRRASADVRSHARDDRRGARAGLDHQVAAARRLMASSNQRAVETVYQLARKADHRTLREWLHDDATWHPAREGAWKPCENAEKVVRTMLWRAHAHKTHPGQVSELVDTARVTL